MAVMTALLVACAAAVAYGLAARVRTVPFAPFLALGAIAVLVPP
jgi:prepilin signal peptidase PulO-like enzyme (type II secretory pathway)